MTNKHKFEGEVNGQKHFSYTTKKGQKIIKIQLPNGNLSLKNNIMKKYLHEKNLISLDLPANEVEEFYCMDCGKVFDYKDLYLLENLEMICHDCDTERFNNKK